MMARAHIPSTCTAKAKHCREFETSLSNIVSSRPTQVIVGDAV